MRGLTAEEREMLSMLAPHGEHPAYGLDASAYDEIDPRLDEAAERLAADGRLREVTLDSGELWYGVTPAGSLALRLDAMARGLTGAA